MFPGRRRLPEGIYELYATGWRKPRLPGWGGRLRMPPTSRNLAVCRKKTKRIQAEFDTQKSLSQGEQSCASSAMSNTRESALEAIRQPQILQYDSSTRGLCRWGMRSKFGRGTVSGMADAKPAAAPEEWLCGNHPSDKPLRDGLMKRQGKLRRFCGWLSVWYRTSIGANKCITAGKPRQLTAFGEAAYTYNILCG